MKGNKKIKLIVYSISFVLSLITSFILGLKIKEDLDGIPSKEEDYIPNF